MALSILSAASSPGTIHAGQALNILGYDDSDFSHALGDYEIDFGDGTPHSTGHTDAYAIIPHTYATEGTYTAVLTCALGTVSAPQYIGPPDMGEFVIDHIELGGYPLPNNCLLPHPDWNFAFVVGTHTDHITSVTFTGGATAPVTGGNFYVPTDLATIRSGPALFEGPYNSQTVDLIVLKPEAPGYTRDFTPGLVEGYLSYGSPFPGSYSPQSVAQRDWGTDHAGSVSRFDNHDAAYSATAAQWNSGTYYDATKFGQICMVTVGWAAGFGTGNGLQVFRTTNEHLTAPAPVFAVDRQDLGLEPFPSGVDISEVHTGQYVMRIPLQAQNFRQAWTNFTAEVYALPATELVPATGSSTSRPVPGPLVADWWRNPSWFEAREPLAVHDFGYLGRNDVQSDVVDLEVHVPDEYVWQGLASSATYTIFAIILKQFREETDDELNRSVDETAPWHWVQMPTPDTETFSVSFTASEAPSEFFGLRLAIQYKDSEGTFQTGYYEPLTAGSATDLHTFDVVLPTGMRALQLWVEVQDVEDGSFVEVIDWADNPGTSGTIRFASRPSHETVGSSGNYASENLEISSPYQEPPYRFWLPENVVLTGGWQVGSVAW